MWRQQLPLTPMYLCLCLQFYVLLFVMCVYECSECGGQKEMLDPIGLGLWVVVNCSNGCWEPNSGPLKE